MPPYSSSPAGSTPRAWPAAPTAPAATPTSTTPLKPGVLQRPSETEDPLRDVASWPSRQPWCAGSRFASDPKRLYGAVFDEVVSPTATGCPVSSGAHRIRSSTGRGGLGGAARIDPRPGAAVQRLYCSRCAG